MKNTIFKITNNTTVSREGEECTVHHNESSVPGLPLTTLKALNNQLVIQEVACGNWPIEPLWLPIRFLKPSKRHTMALGDILKLGKIKLKVKYISLGGKLAPIPIDSGRTLELSHIEDDICRICLQNENAKENPLINPCHCAGSMKYIHALCLKEWLRHKITTRHSDRASSYFWKDISCELCKEGFPSFFIINGERVELVSIHYPDKPYLVLEDYRVDREQESHGIHIVSLNREQSVLIGRAHESDIKLSDVSVSRRHAQIKLSGHSFVIEDLNSKFGTLLQVRDSVVLPTKTEVTVQVSRSLLRFTVKRPWSFVSCCVSRKVAPEKNLVTIGGEDPEHRRHPILQEIPMSTSPVGP